MDEYSIEVRPSAAVASEVASVKSLSYQVAGR